jgi:hypothetical protein
MMIQHYYNVPKDGLLQERLFEEFIPAPKECPKEWLSDPYLKEWWLEEWCNEHGVRSGMSVLRVRPSDVMSAASLRKGLLLSDRPGNLWVTGGVSALGLNEEAIELAAGGVEGALLVFPAVVD